MMYILQFNENTHVQAIVPVYFIPRLIMMHDWHEVTIYDIILCWHTLQIYSLRSLSQELNVIRNLTL